MAPMEPSVVAIVGPTAVGKSALALALAEHLPLEIVSADALQVYRGFDIGTAKPTAEEQRRVPHHLIDILEPWERYSAGEFARRARQAIAGIRQRGRLPVIVGGSGLYLRALLDGISPVPKGDPELRQELRERLAAEGLASLYAELERHDAETAGRLAPGDTQRILRALEVVHASGVPLSTWIRRQPFGEERLSALRLGLTVERGVLYDQIASRVTQMIGRGWLAEVQGLLDRGLDPGLPAFQAIGYRQLVRHLGGNGSLEDAIVKIIRDTRRFAKRQWTWFKKEPEITWFEAEALAQLTPRILEFLQRSGLGRAHG